MASQFKVLLIEDSASDALLLARALSKGGLAVELHRVETPDSLEQALMDGTFDFVISDFRLPGWDGMRALEIVRGLAPDIPFLMISGQVGEDLAAEAMRAGANDFLLKDHLSRLIPAIERELREAGIRRMHRALEAEQRLLHLAIQHAPDWVVITDPEGTILYANPAAEQISGYSRAELLGQNPRLLKSGKHDSDFYAQMWQALLKGQTWRGRLINKRKDQSFWDSDTSISPVRDEGGAITGYVCAARDISHEVELRQQLEQAQRLEAIGLLAGGIAHDFNNALMPILVSAEVALARPDTDPQSLRAFNIITQAAERARDLVRQILMFSRKGEHDTQSIQLHLVVRDALALVRSVLPANLVMETNIDPQSGHVLGDATQLHQVVLNLLTNAAHAMRGRAGLIRVSLTRMTTAAEIPCPLGKPLPAGDYLRLSVEDAGHGIGEEVLGKIFLPFFSTKAPGEGTGLGLSVVHGIVQGIGGGIQVESTVEVGSTFNVFLPSCDVLPTVKETPIAPARSPLRVLLVDDEKTLVAMLEHALCSMGYQVWGTSSPTAALARFEATPSDFDILLTDLTMPEMSGISLAQALWARHPGFPIVLMTGYSEGMDQEHVRCLGFKLLLEKPKSAAEVADALEAAVSSRP